MRGTMYAIAEIAWWMLAAAAIGFAIGWLVRRWRGAKAVDVELQARLDAERSRAGHLAEELAARAAAAEALEEKLAATTKQLEGLRSGVAAKVADLESKDPHGGEPKADDQRVDEPEADGPEPEEGVEVEDHSPPG